MRTIPLLLALAFVVAVYGEPEPGVHRVTGKYITHVHHYKIPAKGGAGGGGGGRGPPGGGGRGRSSKGGGGKGGKTGKCQQGGVTGLANSVNKAGQNILGGAANALGANQKHPGLLGGLAGGVETLGNNVLGGANQAVSDFFCGFNRVFNKIGSKAGKGDLLGGILSGANTFITGAGSFFGNIGTNALGAVTSGVSDAIHGKRGKKGYVHDRSQGKKKGGGLLGGLLGG